MCGILAGPAGAGDARAGLRALAWRGPDGEGFVRLGPWELGCRRLAITDAEAGQPLVGGPPGARLGIAFNGNLWDPGGLRRRVAEAGCPARTRNDAELPLRLYEAFGLEGLRGLAGQFAFALADERRGRLVLARDPFGEKPLWTTGGARPGFASTPPALRAYAGVLAGEPEPGAVAAFLRLGAIDPEGRGFGLGMHALRPGRLLAVEADGRSREVALAPTTGAVAEEGREETLGGLFERAVAGRLEADRPLALLLSGGVDSSLLACLIADRGLRIPCLAGDFRAGRSEGERAARVAGRLGLPLERVPIGPEVLAELPVLVARHGLPFGDASLLALHALCRRAAARGFGVVLTGDGGDELFLGYRRQRALVWAVRARALVPAALRRAGPRGVGYAARFWRAAGAPSDRAYFELLATADPREVARLVPGVEARLPKGLALDARACERPDEAARRADVEFYLRADLCPKLDLASLAAGVEGRAPFLDPELAAFAARYVRAGRESEGKSALRALLARRLPAGLRSGPKRGFGPPLAHWLARSRLPEEWLWDGSFARRAPVEPKAARALLARFRRGEHALAPLLFSVCALALWDRTRAEAMPRA